RPTVCPAEDGGLPKPTPARCHQATEGEAQQKTTESMAQLQEKFDALVKFRQDVEKEVKQMTEDIKRAQMDAFDLGDIQEEINKALSFMKLAQEQADVLQIDLLQTSLRATLLEDAVVVKRTK